ncbi:MAG: hypothetical protein WCG27_08380, partial [Pseudomonadota bacterium]
MKLCLGLIYFSLLSLFSGGNSLAGVALECNDPLKDLKSISEDVLCQNLDSIFANKNFARLTNPQQICRCFKDKKIPAKYNDEWRLFAYKMRGNCTSKNTGNLNVQLWQKDFENWLDNESNIKKMIQVVRDPNYHLAHECTVGKYFSMIMGGEWTAEDEAKVNQLEDSGKTGDEYYRLLDKRTYMSMLRNSRNYCLENKNLLQNLAKKLNQDEYNSLNKGRSDRSVAPVTRAWSTSALANLEKKAGIILKMLSLVFSKEEATKIEKIRSYQNVFEDYFSRDRYDETSALENLIGENFKSKAKEFCPNAKDYSGYLKCYNESKKTIEKFYRPKLRPRLEKVEGLFASGALKCDDCQWEANKDILYEYLRDTHSRGVVIIGKLATGDAKEKEKNFEIFWDNKTPLDGTTEEISKYLNRPVYQEVLNRKKQELAIGLGEELNGTCIKTMTALRSRCGKNKCYSPEEIVDANCLKNPIFTSIDVEFAYRFYCQVKDDQKFDYIPSGEFNTTSQEFGCLEPKPGVTVWTPHSSPGGFFESGEFGSNTQSTIITSNGYTTFSSIEEALRGGGNFEMGPLTYQDTPSRDWQNPDAMNSSIEGQSPSQSNANQIGNDGGNGSEGSSALLRDTVATVNNNDAKAPITTAGTTSKGNMEQAPVDPKQQERLAQLAQAEKDLAETQAVQAKAKSKKAKASKAPAEEAADDSAAEDDSNQGKGK